MVLTLDVNFFLLVVYLVYLLVHLLLYIGVTQWAKPLGL